MPSVTGTLLDNGVELEPKFYTTLADWVSDGYYIEVPIAVPQVSAPLPFQPVRGTPWTEISGAGMHPVRGRTWPAAGGTPWSRVR